MAAHEIRVFGDPVLKMTTAPVTDIDGALVNLVDAMYTTMYEAPGVGLAAPQVGVRKRFFVYDVHEDAGPSVIFNPEIVDSGGEVVYEEGCLSFPGLYFEIVRAKVVVVQGIDIDGNEVVVEADDLMGRVFQHELDHLDGVLMLDRLEGRQRKRALRMIREQGIGATAAPGLRPTS